MTAWHKDEITRLRAAGYYTSSARKRGTKPQPRRDLRFRREFFLTMVGRFLRKWGRDREAYDILRAHQNDVRPDAWRFTPQGIEIVEVVVTNKISKAPVEVFLKYAEMVWAFDAVGDPPIRFVALSRFGRCEVSAWDVMWASL